MKSSKLEINRIAAEWAAKRTSGVLSPEEQACFDAWVAADVLHLGAYGRAIAVLARLDRLRAVNASALRTKNVATPSWSRRWMVIGGSSVGLLAAAGVAGLIVWQEKPEEYSTGIGETRVVVLSDGSVVTLNTASQISVIYSRHTRTVHLVQGEALFNVAKNKQRPFIVFADNTEVRAVGTSFTVRFLQQRPIQILVQEGAVDVMRRDKPNAPVRGVAETQTLVSPNEPIVTRAIPYSQVARGVAWQYGQIAFDNATLEAAATEYARYSRTRIVVDPAVSDRTITGMFPSNDPAGFARAATSVLNLHLEVEADQIRITE